MSDPTIAMFLTGGDVVGDVSLVIGVIAIVILAAVRIFDK